MNKKSLTPLTAVMLILLAAVMTFVCTYSFTQQRYAERLANVEALEQKYAKLNEIKALVNDLFVGEYDEEKAIDSMLRGYVDGLGDKWSGYYDVEQTAIIKENNTNQYVGIGVTFKINDAGEFEITSVNKKGPAFAAGYKIGDIISHINGVPASNFTTTGEVASAVRGEEGTEVSITLRRGAESIETKLVRRSIFNETVEVQILDGNIAHVYITGFETNTEKEFKEKIEELYTGGIKGLILDVRFNGGGYVHVMSEMLDMLLPGGTIISMVDKKGGTKQYNSDDAYLRLPMAVLTNEYSISAAEFFAAVLQEYNVAKVVGDHTGGKGFAQNLFTLSDGSSLNLSTYKYYTPSGKSLAETGIEPDIKVSLSPEDFVNFYSLTPEQDTQLQAALEYVKGEIGQ